VRRQGKTGGAIWVCLELMALPFLSRENVGNIEQNQRKIKKNASYSNASPGSA
jgi:hypothetical protein